MYWLGSLNSPGEDGVTAKGMSRTELRISGDELVRNVGLESELGGTATTRPRERKQSSLLRQLVPFHSRWNRMSQILPVIENGLTWMRI